MSALSELNAKQLSTVTLSIVLPEQSENKAYGPDSNIQGHVWLTLTREVHIQKVVIQFACKETTFINKNRSLLTKNKREDTELFFNEAVLWERSSSDKRPLLGGTYIFPFTLYIPRVNFPQTCHHVGVYKMQYELKAIADRTQKLSFNDKAIRAVDLCITGKCFPTSAQTEVLFDQTVDDNQGKVQLNFKGSINATEFLPGEKYKMNLEVICPNIEYYIKNVRVLVTQSLSIKTVNQGLESFSEFFKTLKVIDVPHAGRVSKSRNHQTSSFVSDVFEVEMPQNLCDSSSGTALISHSLLVIAKLKPSSEKFEKIILHSVVKQDPHLCKLQLPSPIIHVDPKFYPPSVFSNSFSDTKFNASNLSIPLSIQSAKVPELNPNPNEPIRFISWNELHPMWTGAS